MNKAKWVLGAAKAGHAGTLDPAATGLLALAFGEATKTVPFVADARKAYRFTVRWGAATATDDAEGAVIATSEVRPAPDAIRAALAGFTGDILQVPPQVSAVKVEGARAYDLARAGETLELAARPLHVERLELVAVPDPDTAVLEMTCGKGGYVRSIARDLGERLGCLGHVVALRRLWSGPFTLEGAVTWPEIEAGGRGARRPASPGRGGARRHPRARLPAAGGRAPAQRQPGADAGVAGRGSDGLGECGRRAARHRHLAGRRAHPVARAGPRLMARSFLEPRALAALLVAALCAWAFFSLADEVAEGETHAFDTRVLLALRNPADPADPLGPGWVEELGRDVTALGGIGILAGITLAVAGFLWLQGNRGSMWLMLIAVGGGQAMSSLAKAGFDRPRPDLVPHAMQVYTTSFPSGHSMMAAVTYLTLATLVARVQPTRALKAYVMALAVLVTVAVGVSRVYLGVHWPTDVLAGWAAGAAWALGCWLAARWLARRGAVEPETNEQS